jgi:hypothetical protein
MVPSSSSNHYVRAINFQKTPLEELLYHSVQIAKKLQPCNRIYYSTVHWRLNMFRAAYRSSSGALTVFAASGLHTYVNQRLQIQLELLMMSGMPLETCWAFNERRNNKFYYKVASCWLFLLSYTTMHGSMNIKFKNCCIRCCEHVIRKDRRR